MQCLVVEDDEKIAEFLKRGLTEAGYQVNVLTTAEEALGALTLGSTDVAIVDVMLPGKDGLWLITEARGRGVQTPILILSARGSVQDRITGIRTGGDDYLTKPFSFGELLVRLEALLRRSGRGGGMTETGTHLSVGDITMDLLARIVTRQGVQVDLQPREFTLLEYFLRHADQVLTKTMILEHVWHYDFDPQTNVVDVLVSRLRGKIDRNFEPKVIHTVRGVGYVYKPNGAGEVG